LTTSAPPTDAPFSPVEAARLALHCLDLTSLREDDDAASIRALAARAATPHGAPAALCVYPAWVPTAREALDGQGLSAVRIATVVNFPRGESDAEAVADEVASALAAGADEIDVVFPWRALQAGDRQCGEQLLARVRQACQRGGSPVLLKVILETGELAVPALIDTASRIALAAGADFLKTSTGKTARHASPEAVQVMLAAIAAEARPGRRAGIKVSGGVGRIEDVLSYLALAAAVYGAEGLGPDTLRFGASSLLPALLAVLDGQGGSAAPAPGGY
jgi:deoxyribose-phosphate aldolase